MERIEKVTLVGIEPPTSRSEGRRLNQGTKCATGCLQDHDFQIIYIQLITEMPELEAYDC